MSAGRSTNGAEDTSGSATASFPSRTVYGCSITGAPGAGVSGAAGAAWVAAAITAAAIIVIVVFMYSS